MIFQQIMEKFFSKRVKDPFITESFRINWYDQ